MVINKYINIFLGSDKKATTIHCSNSPANSQEWPESKPCGFGNSPPKTTLVKVKAGKTKFEEIIEPANRIEKEKLVDNLMDMLKSREKCVIYNFFCTIPC